MICTTLEIQIGVEACADPEGWRGQGVRTPPEKLQTIGVLSNTGPDPLKIHKATKPVFNFGPFLNGVSLAGR